MITKNPTLFTDKDLSVLVQEYITQQHSEFTLKGLYAYIVYQGMEDKRIAGDYLLDVDKEKVNGILNRIVKDGRLFIVMSDEVRYEKVLKLTVNHDQSYCIFNMLTCS